MADEPLLCSICHKPIEVTTYGWADGNNAEPINSGRCCNHCDKTVVIPARIQMMINSKKGE